MKIGTRLKFAQCPADGQMTPIEAVKWVDKVMMKTFPTGVVKDKI